MSALTAGDPNSRLADREGELATTFSDVWRRTVASHGDNVFLVFLSEDGESTEWTYAQFDDRVELVAATLSAHGVGPGTPVHVVLKNSPAFLAVWIAAARLGAWFVPVDPASTAPDIASQVRRVRPTLSVIGAARRASFDAGAPEAPALVLDESPMDLERGALVENGRIEEWSSVEPSDRLAVMFTSGTTSEPKGVDLTQACYANVAHRMSTQVDLTPADRWFVSLPLFHANAQYYCFSPAIAVGASVALSSTFSASRWVSQARQLSVTHASLFAAPIRMILARTPQDEEPLELSHVWFAQSLGREHHQQFARLVGVAPRQLYGMTETVAIVTADRSPEPTHDRIGPAIDGRRVSVVVPGTTTPAGKEEVGELWVNGIPGVDLFAGYFEAPELTASAFSTDDDGTWFHTGDLAVDDGSGNLRFVGRVDDVIKVSGENVSLSEVEAAVAQAPGVLEVAVIGQEDPVRDWVPVAYVVAKDPELPPTPEELARWSTQNLAPAARPREWHFIEKLPRTSVGKVRRFQIRQV